MLKTQPDYIGRIVMKMVKSSEAQKYTNASSLSESVEYPVNDKDIDCAYVKIEGLYPGNNKYAVNVESKELLFCVEGNGILEMKTGEKKEFKQNDVILIEAGEVYRFDAHCSFVVVCTPPWTPEQHKNID